MFSQHNIFFFELARETLRELGGLELRSTGPGLEHATGTVVFDPLAALTWSESLPQWRAQIGESFVPVGMLDYMDLLFLGESGQIYIRRDGDPENIVLYAVDVWAALEGIVHGKKPMLR